MFVTYEGVMPKLPREYSLLSVCIDLLLASQKILIQLVSSSNVTTVVVH
jgi:hypothetical protein